MGGSLSSRKVEGPHAVAQQNDKKGLLPRERAKNAIVGAFVADAATMPLHRIYDQEHVEQLLRYRSSPPPPPPQPPSPTSARQSKDLAAWDGGCEFFSPCSCPYYTFPVGQCTPYGKEAYPLLYNISSCGFFERSQASEFLYQVMRGEATVESGQKGFLLHTDYEDQAKAINTVSKQFRETREGSSTDTQCLGLVKVPLIVARYAGSPKLLLMVEECVRIHQTSESVLVVCRLAARLLEKVILGMTIREALLWAFLDEKIPKEERFYLQSLTSVGIDFRSQSQSQSQNQNQPQGQSQNPGQGQNQNQGQTPSQPMSEPSSPSSISSASTSSSMIPFSLAAESLGLDAQLPGCFQATLVALYSFRSYKTAIRANIVAGGDNALRSWFIGAMFAAEGADRIDSIPLTWRQACVDSADITGLAQRVVGSNPAFENYKEVNFCKL